MAYSGVGWNVDTRREKSSKISTFNGKIKNKAIYTNLEKKERQLPIYNVRWFFKWTLTFTLEYTYKIM